MISNEFDLPINRPLLRKSLKYLDYDNVFVRDEKYLRDFDINFMFDHKLMALNKEKGQHIAELDDGTAIVSLV